jgi:hypothetical protein
VQAIGGIKMEENPSNSTLSGKRLRSAVLEAGPTVLGIVLSAVALFFLAR